MRLLLVAHYYYPHIGGMEAVVEKQARSLVARGHTVTILTCNPQKNIPSHETRDGYKIIRVPALNFIEKKFGVTYPLVSPLMFLWAMRYVQKYDRVHIHDVFYMTSHLLALACLFRKKEFFLTQHVAMVEHPSKLVMAVQVLMYKTFGKLLFMRAKGIVAYNHIVKNFLIKNGVPPSKILLQFNGIDTNFFSPSSAPERQALRKKYQLPLDKPVVLFVGRLVPKKGYHVAYDAQSSSYLTLIVGDGVTPRAMKSTENCRFFGPASAEQLRDLYNTCDVFLFPAKGEIFTLVMQEAMASGLPVITTDDPGYADYDFSRQHIRLVSPAAKEVQEAIQLLINDEKSRSDMSKYSRKFALDNFNWEKNYETEYQFYSSATRTIGKLDA